MLTIDFAIATCRPEGAARVAGMLLPPQPGVRYVVSWQDHADSPLPPALAVRSDVAVYRFGESGQSLNRNNAIEHCTSDIIVMADDDVTYRADALRELARFYETRPEADFVTFRTERHGAPDYPADTCRLTQRLPRNFHVACFELSFRRSTAGHLRCCPELGLNSRRFHGGEDEVLLLTAIKRGLTCLFAPITLGEHPHPSTGTKSTFTPCNLMAMGCVSALLFPSTAFLRVPLKAYRISRAGRSPLLRALFYLTRGALSARPMRRRNKAYMW
ncbi:MAG: glycosyltransferase [Muribaculaceae bacterium]|nr:glycosyltransferase [Muribaculaceae bacterium]